MIKKYICLVLTACMFLTLASCRKISQEYSSTTSNINSNSVLTDAEIKEDNTPNSTLDATNNTSSLPSNDTPAPSTPSENVSSTTETLKPYGGNLPSISTGKIPKFSEKQFEISGFWAPYEITEESFQQYKDVGFTTLAMINHSLKNNSRDQFYLGSQRTMKALEICKKVGLNAILNYNDWKAEQCEGSNYNGDTPFSKYDLYTEYKDIITGIHICDEPYISHIAEYGNKTLVDDFKSVYPNTKYIVNLIPITSVSSRGFSSYEQMMEIYEKNFMEPFGDNAFVSVDVYPFHIGMVDDDRLLAYNYKYIAESAKKFGVKPGYILQSSIGGGEFEMELSESDLRWEIYSALSFGADTLQYYCYSVPQSTDSNGKTTYMYDNCILNQDNTPSHVYYSLQKLHKEIQSFSDVILSYDWDKSIGVSGYEECAYRVSNMELDLNTGRIKFEDPKHYVASKSTHDLLISRFTNQQYGEAYMFTNFADRGGNSKVDITFRNCRSVAIYGGAGFNGTPKIAHLDSNGNLTLDLDYGEGVFVIPLV